MKRLTSKILAGVAAVAAVGSAYANTTISGPGTGDGSIILNVVDTTTQTSYTFDTGLHVNEFNGSTPQNFSSQLSTDANWTSFINGVGANDTVLYSVAGANAVQPSNFVLDQTSNATAGTSPGSLGSISNSQLKNVNAEASFISAVNNTASSTTFSVFATKSGTPAAYAGDQFSLGTEGVTYTAAIGTAMGFYNYTLNGTSNTTKANLVTFAGQWDLTSAGAFTYAVSSVPLPPGLTLLLSGVVLTTLIARRRNSNAGIGFSAAA